MDEPTLLSTLAKIDFRVGLITEVSRHPNADRLYVERVFFGEDASKTVVSGLVSHFSPEDLFDRKCLFVYNMKPANMRGVSSESMILVAHDKTQHDKVELLTPPADAQPGDRVYFLPQGESEAEAALHASLSPPASQPAKENKPILNPKQKTFESVQPHLSTDARSEVVFLEKHRMMIRGRPVTVTSLVDAVIS